MEIIYLENIKYSEENQDGIINLYKDVGWSSYLDNTKSLINGINNSLYNISVMKNNELIGFIRVVGDDETIIYIQDILVKRAYQRCGIGKELITRILKKYEKVRQIVLMTDGTAKTIEFYKSIGMKNISDLNMIGFVK